MNIAVLGAGAYGTALGGVLTENGHNVRYYDPKLGSLSLNEVLADADYIILCVPSNVAPELLTVLPKNIPLVVATKGFLSDKVFADFKDYMILSGPGFADEIKAKKAIKLTATDQRIIDLFSTNYLSFDLTNDKLGVLICGALKNIYALGAGLSNLAPNTPEYDIYINNSITEIKKILLLNGASAKTAELSCGRDDLVTTCRLPSRNYEFGQILNKNPKALPEKTVESMSALERVKNGDIVVPESAKILKKIMEVGAQ